MTNRTRHTVEAFFAAYGSRDPVGVGALVSDDIDWRVTGPVEVMSFCGHWRGKMAVMRMLRESVPGVFEERTMVNEELLIDEAERRTASYRPGDQLPPRAFHSSGGRRDRRNPHADRQPQRRRAAARPSHRPLARRRAGVVGDGRRSGGGVAPPALTSSWPGLPRPSRLGWQSLRGNLFVQITPSRI